MCCFRWCERQLCLRNMPISGVNLTPRSTAVYASDPASPRRPQDSLPPCLLGFGRTRLALASSHRLLLSHLAYGSPVGSFRIGSVSLHVTPYETSGLTCAKRTWVWTAQAVLTSLPTPTPCALFKARLLPATSWSLPASALVEPCGTRRRCLCLALHVAHPPSYPPSLHAVLLAAFRVAHRHNRTMRALTPAGPSQARQVSPLTPPAFRVSRPQPHDGPQTSLSQSPQRVWSDPEASSASPCGRRLANTPCRNGFVILKATRSPPVASNPASRRRSYSQLRVA